MSATPHPESANAQNGSDRARHYTIELPGGRVLGVGEYGDPAGQPVFYFHGWPGSRLEAGLIAPTAERLAVRVLALDRPGYGISTSDPLRRIHDWPRDVEAVADALGLDRFGVFGVSGGGPYALACAVALAPRLTRVAVVCGLGPMLESGAATGMSRTRRLISALLRFSPRLSTPFHYLAMKRLRHREEEMVQELAEDLTGPDKEILADPAVRRALIATFQEALRPGGHGWARDLRLYFEPWGFHPHAIPGEIAFFHGEQDQIVPAEMSRRLAATIPHARLHLFPQEGHYSLPLRQMERILAWLQTG